MTNQQKFDRLRRLLDEADVYALRDALLKAKQALKG